MIELSHLIIWAFHGKGKNLTLEGGFQTRRSRLKLIASKSISVSPQTNGF